MKHYPTPKFDKIIEPFAGSARYSLLNFQKEILLVDLDPSIIQIWKYLQLCSEKDILNLPDFKTGDDIRNFDLSADEKLFCGFLIGKGLRRPQNIVTRFAGGLQPTWIRWQKKHIAKNLFKIKHWKIELGTYRDIENESCTWFVDPPYQFGGEYYTKGNNKINFYELAAWCRERQGQVIVCENSKADWMDFKPMKTMIGIKRKSAEVIWSNHITNYDNVQSKLLF